MTDVPTLCRRARAASRRLATCDRGARDAALRAIADRLRARTKDVLAANAEDLDDARARDMAGPLLDRLALDTGRVSQMADAVDQIAAFPDPLGEVLSDARRPNGLRVRRVRVPIGVVAFIYESRPNVTTDAG